MGGCPLDKANVISHNIIDNDYKVCVEIGVWRGRSLTPIMVATKHIGGECYGIDPWNKDDAMEFEAPTNIQNTVTNIIAGADFEGAYQDVLKLTRNYPKCKIIRKTAEDAVDDIPDSIDMLHIDGNHDSGLVTIDIKLYVPRVRSGGMVIMDDTNWASVKSCLPLLEEHGCAMDIDYQNWQVWRKK